MIPMKFQFCSLSPDDRCMSFPILEDVLFFWFSTVKTLAFLSFIRMFRGSSKTMADILQKAAQIKTAVTMVGLLPVASSIPFFGPASSILYFLLEGHQVR